MSVAIDTASKVHQKQLEAVTRSQDLVVAALEKVLAAAQGLRARAPQVPEAVAGPVEKVTAPVTRIVGTRSEVAGYLARSTQDWFEVQHKLQADLIAKLATGGKRAEDVSTPDV